MPTQAINDFTPHGYAAPEFEPVKTEFTRNFVERGEIGAACAVYHRGRKVVDLWGGYRDAKSGAPWQEDTLVPVFSTTKGVAALAIAVAQSRGLFGYDDTVATYWAEFAQHGKADITLRQLLSFQAGLCYIDQKLDAAMLADLDGLARLLARQKPAWRPGEYHGYHLFTADSYASELIRRQDPQHRSLGQFFQSEVAAPLGLEFYIGTPDTIPEKRFAVIQEFNPLQTLLHLSSMPPGMLGLLVPNSLVRRVMFNVQFKTPAHMALPPYRSVEFPGGNGIGQVRSLAKLYGVFATGGSELGLKPQTLEALTQPAQLPKYGIEDQVLKTEIVYSLGFIKPFPAFNFSPSSTAFGAAGTGGSFAFADRDTQLGFAYAPNKLGFHQFNDPREKALREAVYRCVAHA
jgi:CubicO group peptidase (beta-lactamase class C family)